MGAWARQSNVLLGERDAIGFVDVLLVVQHGVVPAQAEEGGDGAQRGGRLQHQRLVAHHEAALRAQRAALLIHQLHRVVPLGHALPVRRQVETRDRHLPTQPFSLTYWPDSL